MRPVICLIGVVFVLGMRATAQEGVYLSHYVFDKFQKGKVYFKSGATQEVDLNYNTLTAEMVFDDGGKYLAMGEPEKVDSVVIQGRVFIPGDKRFYELLWRCTAPLVVEYSSTIKEQGSNLGYGMTSNTAAASPLRTLIQSGGAYNLKLPEGFEVIPKHEYSILAGGQYRPANSTRQLNNIFPAKKEFIKDWVKEHHTNFSNNDDMIALIQAIDKN
ncbi:MAG TPA: hypothetical protein VGM31_06110 [Puia sp.]|jgi:hypothetical protein